MVLPKKRITSTELHELYLRSSEFGAFWAFILRLNSQSENVRCSSVAESALSPTLTALLGVLRELRSWVADFPPTTERVRFGNPSFRNWHAHLQERAPALIKAVSEEHHEELAAYLCASFGSEQRLDFGTGHELQFAVLLYALNLPDSEGTAISLVVFPEYLKTTRLLQQTYTLEPAGSRGVWGLDDFAFLPFVWGSAQLADSRKIPPDFVNDANLIRENRAEYLYVDAIGYIKDYKTGQFFEHSPTLWDITGVAAGWPKINMGMLKMYKAEVFGKFPVMQHLLFGSLFRFPKLVTENHLPAVNRVAAGGPVSNVNLDSDTECEEAAAN